MQVRDGMNPVVVTVGPSHTLREAARRMTARGVGAAVIIDDELPGPCIITERDILHSQALDRASTTSSSATISPRRSSTQPRTGPSSGRPPRWSAEGSATSL
jgi:CBS domain-containing protein